MLFGQGRRESLGGYRSSFSYPHMLFLVLLYVRMCAATHHFHQHLLILFSPFRHQKLGAKTRWMSQSMRSTPKWMPLLLAQPQLSTSLQVYGDLE